MNFRIGLVAAALALSLSACEEVDLDPFSDDSAAAPATAAAPANACTAEGCPKAAQFCQARGYTPGTEAFDRCLISVNENLRKGQ